MIRVFHGAFGARQTVPAPLHAYRAQPHALRILAAQHPPVVISVNWKKPRAFVRGRIALQLAAHRARPADTVNQTAQLVPEVVLVHPPPVNAQPPSVGGLAPCSLVSTAVPHSAQVPETLPVRS